MKRVDSARAAVVLLLAGMAARAVAAPAPSPRPRVELESLQAAVEGAVARVSRPAGLMFGRPSRAYHLKGYGAVVVLAPRALPRVRRASATGQEARAFADMLARLERSVEEVEDPAERRRLEEALEALRDEQPPRRWIRPPRPRLAGPPPDPQSLQQEAEAFRREAERAMERAERDVLSRLRVPAPDLEIAAPPVPPAPVIAPVPPAPMAAPAPPVPPEPRVAPVPPPAPGAPMTPGWPFWFGEEPEEDAGPPDRVLSEVRRAILAGLGAHRGALAMLGADEFVVVAVDFVPRLSDRAATRTIVARARKRDLVDHHAGRLTAEAFRARVEFDDY